MSEPDYIAQEAELWTREAQALEGHARFRCLQNIDLWRRLACAVRDLSSGVAAYSIAGRSVTKADLALLKARMDEARGDIESDLNGAEGSVGAVVGRAW